MSMSETFKKFPGQIEDWGFHDPLAVQEMLERFNELLAVNARRKFGIAQNGLALILAFCIEAIQGLVNPD